MTLKEQLAEAVKPDMVQSAPGIYTPRRSGGPAMEMTIAQFVDVGGAQFKLVPVVQRMVRVTAILLGLIGMDGRHNTMVRLAKSGFVEMIPAGPGTYLLNLDSWYNHLRRVAEDPHFWDEGRGNIEHYRKFI